MSEQSIREDAVKPKCYEIHFEREREDALLEEIEAGGQHHTGVEERPYELG